MNKIIGFLGTYICLGIGDFFCFLGFKTFLGKFEWPYTFYSYFICWSSQIQDWAGLSKPWKNIEK